MRPFLLALAACTSAPDPAVLRGDDPATSFADADQDGIPSGPDCDDADPAVFPGAPEVCNDGIDDDCDPATLEAPDLVTAALAPNGGTAVLCPGEHYGNLRLVERDLRIVGGGVATLRMVDPNRPVIEVVGGSVTLEGVDVHGPQYGYENQAPAVRVVGGSLTLRDNVFQNGIGTLAGVILAEQATVVIEDGTFMSNIALDAGGGVLASFGSTVDIRGTTMQASWCSACSGGAIYAEDSALTLSASDFVDNEAYGGAGGAIYALRSDVRLSDVAFALNTAETDGGAIAALSSTLTLLDVTLERNETTVGAGGALWLADAVATLTNVDLDRNESVTSGGAVHAQASAIDGIFVSATANSSNAGGALHLSSDTTVDAVGWTIADNAASAEGGGVFLGNARFLGDAGTVIARNIATEGGGAALVQAGGELQAGIVHDNLAVRGGGLYLRTFSDPLVVSARIERNVAMIEGGGAHVATGEAQLEGAFLGNEADEGGGVWLGDGATLDATVGWGSGPDGNDPDDVASDLGLSWASSGAATVSCGEIACEESP